MSAVHGPMWWGEIHLTHSLLKSGRCDIDHFLVGAAPPEAVGPHEIVMVRVLRSQYPDVVRFHVLARASGPTEMPIPLGIRCPNCRSHSTKVVRHRPRPIDVNSERRRRECRVCGWRFNTNETPDPFQ